MAKGWKFTEGRKKNIKKARTVLREVIHLGKQEYAKRHKGHKH